MAVKKSLVIVFGEVMSIKDVEASLNQVTNKVAIRMKYSNPAIKSLIPEFIYESNELLISGDTWQSEVGLIVVYELVNNNTGFSDCIEIQTWNDKTYDLIVRYKIYDFLASLLIKKFSNEILSIVTLIDDDENCPSAEQIKIAAKEGHLDKYKSKINIIR